MKFVSTSQAGQDRFVHALLPNPGTFLDIGCSGPIDLSNTYSLEKIGWRGLLVDNDKNAIAACRAQRVSPIIDADATSIDWDDVLFHNRWTSGQNQKIIPFRYDGPHKLEIDYLSLDVDAASLAALRQIPLNRVKFRVITIEHDAWRFGEAQRPEMRHLLQAAGYALICKDVACTAGNPYEDWWVDHSLYESAQRFGCSNKVYTEIPLP